MITFTWQPYSHNTHTRQLLATGTNAYDRREIERLGLTNGASYSRRSDDEIKRTQRAVGQPRWKADAGQVLGWVYVGTPAAAKLYIERRIERRCCEPFKIVTPDME